MQMGNLGPALRKGTWVAENQAHLLEQLTDHNMGCFLNKRANKQHV